MPPSPEDTHARTHQRGAEHPRQHPGTRSPTIASPRTDVHYDRENQRMGLARAHSRALQGLQARPVSVEVHLANGLPSFTMVGR